MVRYFVSGLALPASSAAATVIVFITDPGSYTNEHARLSFAESGALPNPSGSKSGLLAIARIAPVLESITIAHPDPAPNSAMPSSSAFSVSLWMFESTVRYTSHPGIASERSSGGRS